MEIASLYFLRRVIHVYLLVPDMLHSVSVAIGYIIMKILMFIAYNCQNNNNIYLKFLNLF